MSETSLTTRTRGVLRISVDLNRCQGHGRCCLAAPGQFRMRGHEVLMHDPAPPLATLAEVERAIIACPVQAIRLEPLDLAGDAP